jgi:hypothetical protein
MFRCARIPLELTSTPIRPVNPEIVQLDISRETAERVRLWPGAGDNEIEVLSVHEPLGQVVIRLQEPARPYEDRIRIRGGRVTREQIEAFIREGGGGRVLGPRGSSWIVERFTEPAERRFLVGFDQRHLFAAQVTSGDTVQEAHEALKPVEVRAAEARWPGQIVRQGEWFFVPVTPSEEVDVRRSFGPHQWRHRLPSVGEPHWAETLATLEDGRENETGARRFRLFVRGTVHHRDHKTVCFDRWRRVYLNAAVRRRSLLARGFYWID